MRFPYVATADGLLPLPSVSVSVTANVVTAGSTATDTVTGVDTCTVVHIDGERVEIRRGRRLSGQPRPRRRLISEHTGGPC